MPRTARRITLEIVSVRVERLQDIPEVDAIAEGIERDCKPIGGRQWKNYIEHPDLAPCGPKASYMTLWELINGAGSWDVNPWVWVVEFKRVEVAA